jgi:VCBS repeat-containing protein
VSTNEDTSVAIALTASDVDDDPLTFAVVEGPSHGTLTGSAPNLIYTPALNYNGPDSFTYKANDGIADSNVATVSLTVNPVNDAPVANAQSVPTDEDIAVAITLTASDVDSGFLTYAIVTPPGHGTLSGSAPSVIYTPASNYHGSDSFTFKVYDGFLDSNVAAVSITVSSVNDPPVASADDYSTNEDTPQLVVPGPGVLGNDADVDGNLLTAILVAGPSHGSLALNADGSFTYTPDLNYNGPDSFTYKANDGTADSNTVTVTLTVIPVNDPPTVTVSTATQAVQYSDGIDEVTVSVEDIDSFGSSIQMTKSWKVDDGDWQDNLPAGLSLSNESCTDNGTGTTCQWKLSGIADVPAGTYVIKITVSDRQLANDVQVEITVEPEDALVAFGDNNPVAKRVEEDGLSGLFPLTVSVREAFPESPEDNANPGEIGLAEVSMTLQPVGPGGAVSGICTPDPVVGTEYDAALPVTCTFDDVPVNTYTVQVTVNGGYYAGGGEDVLVVYDPSLGFATGGGWFYWPGTEEGQVGEPDYYPGDRTNFGFTMKYNKKGKNVQGSLLLIRHLSDGTTLNSTICGGGPIYNVIYRVKSNALDGLALGDTGTYGWASFSGKSTYLDPCMLVPEGSHEFIVYVEDGNEPGKGTDRFWIQIKGQDRAVIGEMSMLPEATAKVVLIQGGNIVVPHSR